MTILSHLDACERALAARGFPAMSPWWREQLTAFYQGGQRQLVLRVGRRGGKSSTLCRVAVLEALYGDHRIPPGDVGVVAIVSTRREEASARIRTIAAILDALRVRHRPADSGIELTDRPIAFRVFPCTIAAVSGFTAILVVADELAKWRDSETGVNPATEVLAALRPTMATMPGARIILSSSPLGPDDAHALAYAAGDTDWQMVAHAPTWLANPTISEEQTRSLEPDDRVWRREYLAIPQVGVSAAFEPEDVDAMFVRRNADLRGDWSRYVYVLDLSGFTNRDRPTVARVGWGRPTADEIPELREPALDAAGREIPHAYHALGEGERGPIWAIRHGLEWRTRPVLCFDQIGCFDHASSADEVASTVAYQAERHGGIVRVIADQYASHAWRAHFEQFGLEFVSLPFTQPNKQRAVAQLRRLMRDRMIAIPPDGSPTHALEAMRGELAAYSERISASGNMLYAARGSGHDDYASLLILAAIADEEALIPGTPLGPIGGTGSGWFQGYQYHPAPLPSPAPGDWM